MQTINTIPCRKTQLTKRRRNAQGRIGVTSSIASSVLASEQNAVFIVPREMGEVGMTILVVVQVEEMKSD